MGVHKEFNLSIYKVSDPVKFAVASKLNKLGYYTKIVEDYGTDIKSFHPEKGYKNHEVEYRQIWTGNIFPYSTIHIPERKTRLLLSNDEFFYWVVNKEVKMALICNAKNCMVKSCLKVIPNNQIKQGEEFYDIQITRFKYMPL